MQESSHFGGKSVVVTGGGGFIGSHLVETLLEAGARVRVAGRTWPDRNLATRLEEIEFVQGDLSEPGSARRAMDGMEIAFNLASEVAGIGYNSSHHGAMFTQNALLGLIGLEAARLAGVNTYVCVSSVCVYPRFATVPTPEAEGFGEDPEPTVLGYGWAKRMAELQARFYAQEYGMNIAIVRPMNAYGPRDNFDLETAHVIPALIRKVVEARDTLEVWGSGNQTRTFIYAKDVARGLMLAAEKYSVADPINLGTNEEVSIRDLVTLIMRLSGRNFRVVFNTHRPEGDMRRAAAIDKAEAKLGWVPHYPLERGLRETIEWYRTHLTTDPA